MLDHARPAHQPMSVLIVFKLDTHLMPMESVLLNVVMDSSSEAKLVILD